MLCLKRGFVLTQKFDAFDSTKMFQLIRNVTPEMQKFYGDFWDQQLVRDLIHAICIDKVRNDRALVRKKAREAEAKARALLESGGNVTEKDKYPHMERSREVEERATEPNTIGEEEEQEEEDGNNKGDDDADFYTAPPPRVEPIYPPIYQPVTPMHPRFATNHTRDTILSIDTLDLGDENAINSNQAPEYVLSTPDIHEMYTTTTESSPFSIISPLAGKGTMPKKGGVQDGLETPHSRMPPPRVFRTNTSSQSRTFSPTPEFAVFVPETQQHRETQERQARPTPTQETIGKPAYIPIHIKGFSPMYIAANITYEEFESRVAQRIEIPDDRFLLYRPAAAGAAKNKWVTVGTQSAWVKLVETCGEEGAVVKVVEEGYFHEDAPDSDDDDENTTTINPTILAMQKTRKVGRPPGRASQMRGSQMRESQVPESQFPEPHQDSQVPDSQVAGPSGIAPARRRNNTGKGKDSNPKSTEMAPKTEKKLSPNASEATTAATAATATITSSGRAIKRSMKAAQALDDKAIKEAANQVTASRLVIKRKREDFAL
ncbi:hypothetical protein P167DRAFT_569856 [Morchella conica CCBAS932]|uniref:Uncharacterized protein n=1 Tax=Morchella conica CCBAS932 TaxID=1392247 RepID=A0A3N4L6J1_9PEZI|nr:hypothetical protein P167DRAFT_569856 [Morchella conica CCBAS932]